MRISPPFTSRRPIVRRHTRSRSIASPHATGRKDVAIVGAGIGGLAAAVALTKAGFQCKVLESSSSLRTEGSAIGVWANGWAALDELGVGDELRAQYLPLKRIELCRGETGRVLRSFSLSDCDPTGTYSEYRGVHRSALVEALAAKLPPGTIEFSASVSDPVTKGRRDGQGYGVAFSVVREGKEDKEECSIFVAADGARSKIAQGLGLKPPRYAGYLAYRGVARLRTGQMPPLCVRQIWGQGVRAGLYQLTENEVYWFVTVNVAEDSIKIGGGAEEWMQSASQAVQGWHPSWQMQDLIAASPLETLSRSRVADRWSLFGPWGQGCITTLGDASHPMTPNLGQGGCVALEAAGSLARALSSECAEVKESLRQFEQERARRCIPLTIRAGLMGTLLQIDNPLVCGVRDLFISSPAFSPSHFLDHVKYER